MRKSVFITVAGLAMFFWLGLWAGERTAFAQVPPDFTYQNTKPSAPVTFSHKFHVTEKKLGCPGCHMKPKLFDMKKFAASSKMKMSNLNQGQYCGACHNGKKAFATKDAKNCAKCHVKK